MDFRRVTVDPERMGGMPCIRDLRFPVASVVAMVADGMSVDEILAEHPDLEADDITESLRYAARITAVTPDAGRPARPDAWTILDVAAARGVHAAVGQIPVPLRVSTSRVDGDVGV